MSGRETPLRILISTIGKRGYLADYFREATASDVEVIGTGNDPVTVGFASCDRSFVMPSICDAEYLPAFEALCDAVRPDAILCCSDLDIQHLSRLRQKLTAKGIACFFPDHQTAMRFVDKAETARFLTDKGMAAPPTYTDLDEAIARERLPLAIKPAFGSASSGYRRVEDEAQARAHWATVDTPIAQPFVAGELINVEACSDVDGRVLGLSAWRRHRSVAGETLLAETVRDERAIAVVRQMLELSPIPGPIDVDIIRHGGTDYILEVNTRFGGGYPTSHLAGADFPGLMIDHLAGRTSAPLVRIEGGVIMMKKLTPVRMDQVRPVVVRP